MGKVLMREYGERGVSTALGFKLVCAGTPRQVSRHADLTGGSSLVTMKSVLDEASEGFAKRRNSEMTRRSGSGHTRVEFQFVPHVETVPGPS